MEKKINNKVLYVTMVILSGTLQAAAYTSFTEPAGLYPSGVSGFSRLLSNILLDFFQINIPYSYFYFSINLILAIIVFKYIGKWFTCLSLLQTGIVSLLTLYLKPIIVLDEPILLAVFGGVINGISSGLALEHNASTGGLDFLTIYFSNKYNKSLWSYTFGFNCLMVLIAGVIYGWEVACYSIIFQFCTTQMIKKMHKRYTHQTITIITKKPDEVTSEILSHTRHGITQINCLGAYRKEEEMILYTVVNSFQSNDVVSSALKADPNCFINIQNTVDVHGNYYQKPLD
ncbi:MAG: YitT family protein [Erysipelotrichaceae bacterium]|nr:YitT family protein [Erysipelotrichaceae bacterium]